jgi:hypothetical protein
MADLFMVKYTPSSKAQASKLNAPNLEKSKLGGR